MPRLVVLTSRPAPSSAVFARVPWRVMRDARPPGSAKIARQRLGPLDGPVDEPDLGNPQLGQRRDDRAGRAAGAEHDRRSRRSGSSPARIAQIFAKPERVGVVRFETTRPASR